MKLRMIGCSHHRSPVEVRERLAFTPEQARDALRAWREARPGNEAVLLSTCNRVEFYVAAAEGALPPCPRLMARHLADARGTPLAEVADHLDTLRDEQAIEHLFRVAASLDSMVLGEPQIVAQVKSAYEQASTLGSAGPVTHACFQGALRVAKRVATETALHQSRVSIPSVAIADFAGQIFERFEDKRVLVIGAGEMADETLRYLVDAGARHFVVVNRDPLRAEQLALAWRGESAPLSDLANQLARADVVVSTTGAPEALVTLEQYRAAVAPARRQRPLFVLDLAMPRDFDPRIGQELGVYLYSIDDLDRACQQNRRAREQELPKAEAIIRQECERFLAEARGRMTGPFIARLREGLEGPKRAELVRLFARLPELDDRQREEVARFADRLVNKMLHPPMESLRHEARQGSPRSLLDALARLFQIKD